MPLIEVHKKTTLTGHRDCIYTLEKAGVEHYFFSAAGDGLVVLWNLEDPDQGTLMASMENSVYALRYLPRTNQLLVGQNFKGIHLIDIDSKRELRSAAITDSYIFDIAYLDHRILVATGDGMLVVIHQEDFTTLAKLKLSDKSIRSIAISPDNRYIALGFSDHKIKILDAIDLSLVKELNGHTNSVFTLRFSPDGNYLLSGGRDAHLNIWEVKSFTLYSEIVAHMFAINSIDFSPSGLHFATCSMDKSIKLWNAKTFQLEKVIDKARFAGHGTSINKLYWANHHELLISCSDDRTIAAWDIQFN